MQDFAWWYEEDHEKGGEAAQNNMGRAVTKNTTITHIIELADAAI